MKSTPGHLERNLFQADLSLKELFVQISQLKKAVEAHPRLLNVQCQLLKFDRSMYTKLRQLELINQIGRSNLKSDDQIRFRLNDFSDSDVDIRF